MKIIHFQSKQYFPRDPNQQTWWWPNQPSEGYPLYFPPSHTFIYDSSLMYCGCGRDGAREKLPRGGCPTKGIMSNMLGAPWVRQMQCSKQEEALERLAPTTPWVLGCGSAWHCCQGCSNASCHVLVPHILVPGTASALIARTSTGRSQEIIATVPLWQEVEKCSDGTAKINYMSSASNF